MLSGWRKERTGGGNYAMKIVQKWVDRDKLKHLSHTHGFHITHGVAHVFYFIAVMVEGHGAYALIGGAMVGFSLLTVLSDE